MTSVTYKSTRCPHHIMCLTSVTGNSHSKLSPTKGKGKSITLYTIFLLSYEPHHRTVKHVVEDAPQRRFLTSKSLKLPPGVEAAPYFSENQYVRPLKLLLCTLLECFRQIEADSRLLCPASLAEWHLLLGCKTGSVTLLPPCPVLT